MKKSLIKAIVVALLLSGSSLSLAQIFDPVKWSFSHQKVGGNEYELVFIASIDKGWHLYSQFIKDGGPIPTSFQFKPATHYELLGKTLEVGQLEKAYDPNFEMDLQWFSNKAVFKQKIKVLTEKAFNISGFLTFMCCDDQKCLPPKDVEFSFKINPGEEGEDTTGINTENSRLDTIWQKGMISFDEFNKTYPSYKELGSAYRPKNEALEYLNKITDPVEIEVFFGDWCQDSRQHVPTFNKLFELTNNSQISIKYIALDREKKEPAELVNSRKIKFVPTFIVYSQGREVGRIVESPFESIENNLISILMHRFEHASEQSLNTSGSASLEEESLWFFFFIALLAGFAAILTPCVFPMIPMTVSFFMQEKDNKTKSAFKAITYGVSIIIIYTLIGIIVSVTLGPDFINWLSTHWLPNILFFLLFTVFAASFFGMFEIVLPGWLVNKSDKQADKGGYLGVFFMALTLVLVSFSCTAPLVGGLLVEAARGSVAKPVVGMFGFSLAFALPFTLLAFFPSWLAKLPKSGGWLNSVKVVLGFLILALGMKFLIIPDQTYHWNILDREVYIAIWIVIFLFMGLYLLGKLKLPHDSEQSFISVPRMALALAIFAFVVYLIPGMLGAPLKAISGLLPSPASHDFDIGAILNDKSIGAAALPNEYSTICDEPKYGDFLHFPHKLNGYFDYEQGMACAKKINKPVFLDFNGHGCANCKDMEARVWSDPNVLEILRNDYVLIALYVDDKKELPEAEWVTSDYDGKTKKTIGEKNADFQIWKFNNNAQPFYVLLNNEGEPLSESVGRVGVKQFVEFLEKGKKEYTR